MNRSTADDLFNWLDHAKATRIAGDASAQAVRLSLPLPRGAEQTPTFKGVPTQSRAVGFRNTGGDDVAVRRSIITAVTQGEDELSLSLDAPPVTGAFEGPAAQVDVVDKAFDVALPWEVGQLTFSGPRGTLRVRVGLVTPQGLNWWQWVTMETIASGPVCTEIRAAGAIPVHFERDEELAHHNGHFVYPYLHVHNHVRGEVFARLYANGVVELHLRHVNGRFFTEGGDHHDVMPVFGFTGGALPTDWPQDEQPVSSRVRCAFGGAQLDTNDAAYLLGDEHPGKRWTTDDGVAIYQPYEAVAARAGAGAAAQHGHEWLSRAEDRMMPKGVARTARMVASVGDAPPDVAVYAMPAWWYGMCEEFAAAPLLPVRDHFQHRIDAAREHFNEFAVTHCFDDGAIPRGKTGSEPGWEGEVPFAQFQLAWLTGDRAMYSLALRNAYQIADVAIDHALFSVRMHGYASPALSLPMQRVHGAMTAYLETGDTYLYEQACAVIESAYHWDAQNWPRRAFGRDGAYIRGLVFMYRHTGERFYLRRARQSIARVVQAQQADGSFMDQGNTTGIHATVALIVKPWMGCIAVEGLVDYLDFVDDPDVAACVMRFADFLLANRLEPKEPGDAKRWPYQFSYAGGTHYPVPHGDPITLPSPNTWHVEYLAKVLGFASLHSGKADYYNAWRESSEAYGMSSQKWDHGANKAVQNIPVLRAKLWHAVLGADGIDASPNTELASDLNKAVVTGPEGDVDLTAARSTVG